MSVIIPESAHATALKQVWMHEEPDTICEEQSCINPATGHIMPTDIVNHRLKIAIEVQSAFHDVEEQKIKDGEKKKFWINSGYDFYALDHRDYTIIDMIQIFFPYINDIPEYVDFKKKFIEIVQLDIDKNFVAEYSSIESAEKAIGCAKGNIRNALKLGRNYSHGYYWVKKDDYISGNYNVVDSGLRSIVQLDTDGNFIEEYISIAEASKITGIRYDNIHGCKKLGRTYSCGYHWVYKEDYESGNYMIYMGNPKNIPIRLVCLDLDGKYIAKYDSAKDAERYTGVKSANIRKALRDGRSYSGGYHWIREEEYLNNNYKIYKHN